MLTLLGDLIITLLPKRQQKKRKLELRSFNWAIVYMPIYWEVLTTFAGDNICYFSIQLSTYNTQVGRHPYKFSLYASI